MMEKALTRLLEEAVALGLREVDADNVRLMINVNEWGKALDLMITQIYEFHIPLTVEFLEDAAAVASRLGIEWNDRYGYVNYLAGRA
jgi:hypothetical protein